MNSKEKELVTLREGISQILSSSFDARKIHDSDIIHKMLDNILYALNESILITITDVDGFIIYANQNFCDLSKYSKEEIVGQSYEIIYSGYYSEAFFEKVKNCVMNGQTWRGDIHCKAKDGSSYWVHEIIVPVLDEEMNPYYFISFIMDITESKELQNQFKKNFIRAFQNLQNGIFKVRKDPDGELRYSMSEGKLMDEIEATSGLILNKTPYECFDYEIAKLKEHKYLQAFEGNRVQYEMELNGRLIFVDIEPIQHQGELIEIVGTVHNFSEFLDIQKQLKAKEQRFQSLINYSHEYITMVDKNGKIIQMNPPTMALFKVEESMFGLKPFIEIFLEEDQPIIAKYIERAMHGEVQNFEFEVKNNNQYKYLNATFVPTVIDNQIEGIYAIGKDITEEKLVQERNAYLAHHDELTGLPNRRWMEQKIHEVLEASDHSNKNIAILSIDLDRFKSINDTLGHIVGDELLKQISDRLIHNEYKNIFDVARMGGDELMLLCTNFESNDEVLTIAENVLQSLEKPFYVHGSELLITASIGIVFNPTNDDTTVTELMKRVDVALYKAKEYGRNMYQVYDKSMNEKGYRAFELERDLRKAIVNDEFMAYLQPKVDALTGKTIGAEALIRWNHPEQGLIAPFEFIPIAEETGLINALGKWMKRKVCQQLVQWRDEGYQLIPISVNISSNHLLQDSFAEDIQTLLNRFGLEGELLEIEITENSIMQNEKTIQKTLKKLDEMGVKVFIDDFGTGYSSFNYLKTFKLDGIKIDRSFIMNIEKDPENASITSAMIKMAQQLKLEVIAEGVETEAELAFLLGENCHCIQGYYFGKPCPIEKFEQKFLRKL